MEIDANKLLADALRDGLREGIKNALTRTYNNPLDEFIVKVLQANAAAFRGLIEEAVTSAAGDPEFRCQIVESTRHTLAKTLVQRFGGELEKQVNALKSDPTTRARITLAIEEIVKTKGT